MYNSSLSTLPTESLLNCVNYSKTLKSTDFGVKKFFVDVLD